MTPRDIFLALSVAVVWGLTFIAIKVGVGETSPLILSALRFVFAAIPCIFFIRPPRAPAWIVVAYGLLLGVGQFGLLFVAIHQGFPVGLASLVVMSQVFFTIGLARAFLGEAPRRPQLIGAGLGLGGMALIGSVRLAGSSFEPFALVVLAAFFWGSANTLAKTLGRVHMFAFTAWSSLAPPIPLLLLSLSLDGPGPLLALAHPSGRLVGSVVVVAYAGTLFGYGVWARLLARYPAATVTPFALLVPVVGMIAGALIFREPLGGIELAGGVLVMAGLALSVLGGAPRRSAAVPLAVRGSDRDGRGTQVIHARYQGDP